MRAAGFASCLRQALLFGTALPFAKSGLIREHWIVTIPAD